jgi:hypothetical protein
MKQENIGSASIYGASLNGSVRQVGPLSGFVGINGQYIEFDSGGAAGLSSTGTLLGYFLNANVTAMLSPTLRMRVTGNYSPSGRTPQGNSSGYKQANVAFTQRLLDDRGVLTLSIVDPFNLSNNVSTTRDEGHEQTGRTNNRIRRANLSFSLNFGRPPQSNRRTIQDDPTATSGGGL